jgi:hypothetical protein
MFRGMANMPERSSFRLRRNSGCLGIDPLMENTARFLPRGSNFIVFNFQ